MRFPSYLILPICLVLAAMDLRAGPLPFTNFNSSDYSAIRGANYCAASGHHLEHWLNYDPRETERDLDYARRVGINQVRVFLSYPAYLTNKVAFRSNLVHLTRACQARGIGLMPVVTYKRELIQEPAPYPLSRAWAEELIDTLAQEPALTCWDVFNEPDYPPDATNRLSRIARARSMAQIFRELDTRRLRTPVTIGFTYEHTMEENQDAVDVLSFHDYSPTREAIRSNVTAAVSFAHRLHKPIINTELGCTGRANPYDVSIEEYSKAHVGFYMWELMITKYWGDVHGIFYPDGTVRDPSIVAAMLGIYRNRSTNAVQEFPDREGWVTRTMTSARKWLNDTNSPYAKGLDLAETAANLLEANELVPMRDPPTRRVSILREEAPDPSALRDLLTDLLIKLEPYRRASQVR